MAVMEGLMTLYTHSILSLSSIVASVRRISTVVASRDLPTTLSEGLLLWLNRLPLITRAMTSLPEGLADGRTLACLLLHYTPDTFQASG